MSPKSELNPFAFPEATGRSTEIFSVRSYMYKKNAAQKPPVYGSDQWIQSMLPFQRRISFYYDKAALVTDSGIIFVNTIADVLSERPFDIFDQNDSTIFGVPLSEVIPFIELYDEFSAEVVPFLPEDYPIQYLDPSLQYRIWNYIQEPQRKLLFQQFMAGYIETPLDNLALFENSTFSEQDIDEVCSAAQIEVNVYYLFEQYQYFMRIAQQKAAIADSYFDKYPLFQKEISGFRRLEQNLSRLFLAGARFCILTQDEQKRKHYLSELMTAMSHELDAFFAIVGNKDYASAPGLQQLERYAALVEESDPRIGQILLPLQTHWSTIASEQQQVTRKESTKAHNRRFYRPFTDYMYEMASSTTGDTQQELSRFLGYLDTAVKRGLIRLPTPDDPLRIAFLGPGTGLRIEEQLMKRYKELFGEAVQFTGIDSYKPPITSTLFDQYHEMSYLEFFEQAHKEGVTFDMLYGIWSSFGNDTFVIPELEREFMLASSLLRPGGALQFDTPFRFGAHGYESLITATQGAGNDPEGVVTISFSIPGKNGKLRKLKKKVVVLHPLQMMALGQENGLMLQNASAAKLARLCQQAQADDTFLAASKDDPSLEANPVWQTSGANPRNRITWNFVKPVS